jgi:hypothetical protein
MVDEAAEMVSSKKEEGMGMWAFKKVKESQINDRVYSKNSIPHLGVRVIAA